MTGQIARTTVEDEDEAVVEVEADGPTGDPIDEQPWIDDLMADAVEDPIMVTDDAEATPESEDDR